MPDYTSFYSVRPSYWPMASSDEDTLKATRPQVAVWVDKSRHAGHVVFVRKMRSGAKRNAGVSDRGRRPGDDHLADLGSVSVGRRGWPPTKRQTDKGAYGKFAETCLVAKLLEDRSLRAVGWQGRLGRERQVCRPHREGENPR